MELLNMLSPGECMILLSRSTLKIKPLFRITLKDLCLKRCIRIYFRESSRGNGNGSFWIEEGEDILNFDYNPFESLIIDSIKENHGINFRLDLFVEALFNYHTLNYRFTEMITKSVFLEGCFEGGGLKHMIGEWKLSKKGWDLGSKLKLEFDQLEKRVLDSENKNDPEILEDLKSAYGNLFMLDLADNSILDRLEKRLFYTADELSGSSDTAGYIWDSYQEFTDDINYIWMSKGLSS